ncbi:MAG: hypothetical protein KJN87_11425 [Desulfofustis sp.]|nr:hypothetical protein [Desulfofustis sp.]
MSDDSFYIRAAREALQKDGACRQESLWREAQERAGKNQFEVVNNYVNLRVAQLRDEPQSSDPAETEPALTSVGSHPDFVSVAKYCAKNNVDARHVIQSIIDGHYIGREVGGEWFIYIGKSKFGTFEEKKKSFFFDNANALAESGHTSDEPDKVINLNRKTE